MSAQLLLLNPDDGSNTADAARPERALTAAERKEVARQAIAEARRIMADARQRARDREEGEGRPRSRKAA